jgi:hypothetical protein
VARKSYIERCEKPDCACVFDVKEITASLKAFLGAINTQNEALYAEMQG